MIFLKAELLKDMKRYVLIIGLLFPLLLMFENVIASEPFKIVRITDFQDQSILRQNIIIDDNQISPKMMTEKGVLLSTSILVPITNAKPFFTFAIVWEATNWEEEKDQLFIRLLNANGKERRITIVKDPHADQSTIRHISELYFIDPDFETFQFRIEFGPTSTTTLQNLEFHFYNPGVTPAVAPSVQAQPRYACPCPPPNALSREQWCPTNNCPPHPDPTPISVTHLIVHHSAGTNSSNDWAAVVRGIWNFHVTSNGWDDIGYNYLVDPNGVVYEGRGDNILGAHFCGQNSNTLGICMMGNFTNITPEPIAIHSLAEILAWKTCDINADPLGQSYHTGSGITLPNISGHRDGCATACPGDMFYPLLPTVRQQVVDIVEECMFLAPPSNLTGMPTPAAVIELNWKDNASNETAFIIERSKSNNTNYEIIGSTGTDVTTFDDPDVVANARYFYRVKSANAQDTSAYSNEAEVLTVLSATNDLTESQINIYPNPVQDLVEIEIQDVEYRTIKVGLRETASGRQALSKEFSIANQPIQLSMSGLPSGLYLLRLEIGTQIVYKKLVKL